MRAARTLALAASRVSLRACVRTRRPVVFDGVVAVVRRAAGLRAGALTSGRLLGGRRLASRRACWLVAVVVVVLVVFSAMWLCPPVLRIGFQVCVRLSVPGEHMYVNRSPGRVTAACELCITRSRGARERAVNRARLCADTNAGSVRRKARSSQRLGARAASPRDRSSSATVGIASGALQTRLRPSMPRARRRRRRTPCPARTGAA